MAFDDRDTTVPRPRDELESIEKIEFVRDRSLPGVKLRVTVTGKATYGANEVRRTTRSVPQSVIDANWPGTTRTLKAWMLLIIDAAV